MPEDIKLVIFKDKSVLEKSDGTSEVFEEGQNSLAARTRTKAVKDALARGFLRDVITSQLESPETHIEIDETHAEKIKALVDSVTSEVGRALIGIVTMQFCIKAICPEQSIRLHKGGTVGGGNFSWKEGISMRTLDKSYITPVLREFDLLRLNADGFMMTRSLAENYPYTKLYKAALRGGKNHWLEIVEDLESGSLAPINGLRYLISILINRSNNFIVLSGDCLDLVEKFIYSNPPCGVIKLKISEFVGASEYSARVFEIVIHAAYQALDEMDMIDGFLKPISQMRSANKKHGNIGDIEILETATGMLILEAWDAKYGKPNLREELEELSEKLAQHPECKTAGFITNTTPTKSEEITRRIDELEQLYDCAIKIHSFDEWFEAQILNVTNGDEEEFCHKWLIALAESFCQKRRQVAPIDEPCEHWIRTLMSTLS